MAPVDPSSENVIILNWFLSLLVFKFNNTFVNVLLNILLDPNKRVRSIDY